MDFGGKWPAVSEGVGSWRGFHTVQSHPFRLYVCVFCFGFTYLFAQVSLYCVCLIGEKKSVGEGKRA